MAARSPATPAPTTIKSTCPGTFFMKEEWYQNRGEKNRVITRSPDSSLVSSSYVEKIKVKLGHNSYDVLIGDGLLRDAGRVLRRLLPSEDSHVFVITSPNVRRHWGEKLETSLHRAKLKCHVLEMNDGEPAKKLETV